MYLKDRALIIRDATEADAEQLCIWWNDGAVMAHAGFPLGLQTTSESIRRKLASKDGNSRHMLLWEDRPIGEMNYRDLGEGACEIGIKICDASMQNRGLGRAALRMFIRALFDRYDKIVLDTNLNNKRAQHVYESLGFRRIRINMDSWTDQLGVLQSSVEYAMTKAEFAEIDRNIQEEHI